MVRCYDGVVTYTGIGAKGSAAAKGAANELIACAHLMSKGYYVFRCQSPNAPFDLVAYIDGECIRVEVKSISYSMPKRSKVSYVNLATPSHKEYDLLIAVGKDKHCFEFSPDVTRAEITDAFKAHYGLIPRLE